MAKTISSQQWESALDGISNLKLATATIPFPSAGEVLVKINSVSLNYKDGETIEGLFNHHKAVSLPQTIIPCADSAGEILEIGEAVTKWKKGDRVLSVSYPEYLTGKITQEQLGGGIGSTGKGCPLHPSSSGTCAENLKAFFANIEFSRIRP
jgi:NADPH:quinone reductase-like Zn-dependent oxidoreductase